MGIIEDSDRPEDVGMLKNVRLARQRKILSELAEECQTEGVRTVCILACCSAAWVTHSS